MAQLPLFKPFFFFFLCWVGPWVGGSFVGFIVVFICFQTQQNFGRSQKPYYNGCRDEKLQLVLFFLLPSDNVSYVIWSGINRVSSSTPVFSSPIYHSWDGTCPSFPNLSLHCTTPSPGRPSKCPIPRQCSTPTNTGTVDVCPSYNARSRTYDTDPTCSSTRADARRALTLLVDTAANPLPKLPMLGFCFCQISYRGWKRVVNSSNLIVHDLGVW